MTQRESNHVLDGNGLNYDDYSFTEGSIPGAEKLKLKDVLDSGKFHIKKTVPGPEKPLKNKSVLGGHKIITARVFKSDVDMINVYLSERKCQ